MWLKLYFLTSAVLVSTASGALSCLKEISPETARHSQVNLRTFWRSFYDVDRVGTVETDGSFALVFDHQAEALGLGPAFTTIVMRTDLEGETLPEAIAQEVQMRCGANQYCSRDAVIGQLQTAYERLYSRYRRQGGQRRNVVAKYEKLDRDHAARTTHFFLLFEGEFVGHTQVQYSRHFLETLNMESYQSLPRRPPGVHVEVGRTVLSSDALPLEATAAAPLNAFLRLYLYRLAFSYSLWDLGANRIHFEVTPAGFKVFQNLSRVPLPASTVQTENGPLNFIDISRNLGLHLEEELMEQLMQWRLTRVVGHQGMGEKDHLRLHVSRSEREVWLRLGWLHVGERGSFFPIRPSVPRNGWDISLSDFSDPRPMIFPISRERAEQWLSILSASLQKPQ